MKSAIVTGAGRGIGAAIAARLEQADFKVHRYNLADGNDVKNVASIAQFLRPIESLDLLVNNAAVCVVKPFEEFTFEDWRHTFETNLTGVFNFCKLALPQLKKARGTIINIGSRAGVYAHPDLAAYCASKAGLMQFTEALALDLKQYGIRVGCVMPGIVNTRLSPIESPSWAIQPEDVAEAVLSMVSMPARTSFGRVELRPTAWS